MGSLEAEERAASTLSLLPKDGDALSSGSANNTGNQLTMFYAGSVNVYDNVPEDKAHAIMLLAGTSVHHNVHQLLRSLVVLDVAPTLSHLSEPASKARKLADGSSFLSLSNQFKPNMPMISCPTVIPSQALPQARKASLTRFLQKRKQRVQSLKQLQPGEERNVSASSPETIPQPMEA